jgi:hypothetical protein
MSSRRRFLADSSRVSLAVWAALGQAHLARAATAGGASELQLLGGVSRVIFPHDDLPDDVYLGIAGELLMIPELKEVLRDGVGKLGDFLELDQALQISRLKSIENGEVFTALKTPLMFNLYNTRELWDLIDYPGPSFPLGYINRGFDDIDWLPVR